MDTNPNKLKTRFQSLGRRASSLSQHIIAHPILFAILPVVSLAANNIHEISLYTSLRPVILLAFIAILLMSGLKFLLDDPHQAAILSSIFFLLFFSYGHVYFGLVTPITSAFFSSLGLVGNHTLLGLVWTLLFIFLVWAILRARIEWMKVTKVMNLMALAALIFPLIQIITFELQSRKPWPAQTLSLDGQRASVPIASADLPDIYYIVLDGYGRSDILQDKIAFDNQAFIRFLEDQGFFVAHEAHSNYVQTSLSLSSSLNLTYLDFLNDPAQQQNDSRTSLARLLRWNEARRFLERQGYQTVALASGYRFTELDNADVFLRPRQVVLNPLEGILFETSAAILIQEIAMAFGAKEYYPGYQSHRNLVNFSLDALPALAGQSGPKFVFAHIVTPHPPFVFGPTGEPIEQTFRYSFMDGDAYQGTTEQYLQGYRDQLQYINTRMQEVIRSILEQSARPPVIIIQGDHGPGSGLDYNSFENTDLEERLSILNAYYLPDGADESLFEQISPVNSFRIIFNHFFNTELAILPDRSYYSTWSEPFNFIEVSDLSE